MNYKRWVYLILSILGAVGILSNLTTAQSYSDEVVDVKATKVSTTHLQTHQSDDSSLQFILNTPPLTLERDGQVLVDGLPTPIVIPGAPSLPHYVTYIAVPPEAEVSITVQTENLVAQKAEFVSASPRQANNNDAVNAIQDDSIISELEALGFPQPPTWIEAPDLAVYQRDAFFPETVYELSEPMYYRDLRLVKLRLYPVRYNPISKELTQAQEMIVSVQFHGSQLSDLRPLSTANDITIQGLADHIINFDQAITWRSLPAEILNIPATNFPTNAAETYKIEVNQDGIYEINGADLAAKGMNLGTVNPATIEMMYRGQPVAYQFIEGGNPATFEPADKIRFYGWAFDGPRTEKQFINNNVYWLWAGGTPTYVGSAANQTGNPIVTSTMSELTVEPEDYFSTTYTDRWDSFPNEPDSWYWDFIVQGPSPELTKTYQVNIPNPKSSGSDATYTVELLSRERTSGVTGITYTVNTYINSYPGFGEATWTLERDLNIVDTVPPSALIAGNNDFKLVFSSTSQFAEIYLNRITVDYLRELVAIGDELIFKDESGGDREFHISGFSENDPASVLVWNITNSSNPIHIQMGAGNIIGGGSYTYKVGTTHAANSKFIATTAANIGSVANISQYIPVSLEPPGGGAQWVAITHADLNAEANNLAAHRASFSNLSTMVVDIEDITNQYGYGLRLPAAIKDYLAYALGNWSPAPGYVTIFGAATYNPRNLDCFGTCPGGNWDKDQPTLVVTDLVYIDRFQGLIPSDFTFSTLIGNDLLPDLAIGRITAETAEEAGTVVEKIIMYEQALEAGEAWQQNMLFVADNADGGGNFQLENQITADDYVPDYVTKTMLFLVDGTQAETDALRASMFFEINGPGVAILNYRGHGSVGDWASPFIISTDNTAVWSNVHTPTVILSADCLDGNFAFPGLDALSQTVLTLNEGASLGTAAHWSAVGLGFTYEHSAFHRNFYDGLYKQGMVSIGDSINYSKVIYDLAGYHDSELYGFMLQGDPAMDLFSIRHSVYLPTIIR